ncbi:MAG: hypothetical protein NVS1B9_02670 [Solirubrobacteraceae bacterium]
MSSRARIGCYALAISLALGAVLALVTVPGRTGQALAVACGSLGGIGLISIVFLEVGLSEDRERARIAGAKQRPTPPARAEPQPRRRLSGRPRRRG